MLELEDKTTIGKTLYLTEHVFPKCESAENEISWQQLDLEKRAKV